MNAKALLLDCGGVMIYPPTGDWTLTEDMREILGEDFLDKHLEEYRRARKPFDELIPDSHRIEDETTERALMECFYRRVFAAMGRAYTDAQYDRLTLSQTQAGKYGLFDDVKAALARWHGQIALGIVSDAPPSTRAVYRRVHVFLPGRLLQAGKGHLSAHAGSAGRGGGGRGVRRRRDRQPARRAGAGNALHPDAQEHAGALPDGRAVGRSGRA